MKEEEIQSLLAQHQALQQNAEALVQQINAVSFSRQEIERAINSLDELEGVEAGCETLVPLGAGSYVHASLTRPDRVLLGVGAGVVVEKERDSARETLAKRKDELVKLEGELKTRLEGVGQQLRKIESLAQKFAGQQRQESQQP